MQQSSSTPTASIQSHSNVGTRIFTDAELQDLVTPEGDKATELIRRQRYEDARKLCAETKGAHLYIAAIYVLWNSQTLAHVYKSYGLKVLVECIEESLPSWFRPVVEMFRNG